MITYTANRRLASTATTTKQASPSARLSGKATAFAVRIPTQGVQHRAHADKLTYPPYPLSAREDEVCNFDMCDWDGGDCPGK